MTTTPTGKKPLAELPAEKRARLERENALAAALKAATGPGKATAKKPTPEAKTAAKPKTSAAPAPARRRKFNNVPTVVGGIRFDSKRESERWLELKAKEKAGLITGLSRQVPFSLVANNQKICEYRADFTYYEGKKHIVEDLKGVVTETFRLKAKLMKILLGIEVRITK